MPDAVEVLERLAEVLGQLEDRDDLARRVRGQVERDLLPRQRASGDVLIVGIVGPNNAGKSALFNALAGRVLSPSLPTGGATARLVGAAAPATAGSLEQALGERFAIERLEGGVDAARVGEAAALPSSLLLASSDSLPERLLLIDTPDFDSIFADNRHASESLLAVADLVIAVVTRHSYQNREVVDFLGDWLAHGRPWMLVYNEAPDEDVARAHGEKLAKDLGGEPLAAFWAPLDLEVQRGTAPLTPRRVGGTDSLATLLNDVREVDALKAAARAASAARVRDDLARLVDSVRGRAAALGELRAAVAAAALGFGRRVAAAAMPAGPFIEAFRRVLDRRSNPLSRSWRGALRGLRSGIEALPRLFAGASSNEAATGGGAVDAKLLEIEAAELARIWPEVWKDFCRDFGEAAAHVTRRDLPPALAAQLDEELRADPARALAGCLERHGAADVEFEGFGESCEALVEEAIEERGRDWDIQIAADLLTVAPVAAAAIVIVNTGGVGADVAAAGGGAVSTFLMERYSHLLGSGITRAARDRWAALRGRALGVLLAEATLGPALERIDEEVAAAESATAELLHLSAALAEGTTA